MGNLVLEAPACGSSSPEAAKIFSFTQVVSREGLGM
jgi:hypothetical protein